MKPEPLLDKKDYVTLGKNLDIIGDLIKKNIMLSMAEGGMRILEEAQPHVPIFKDGIGGANTTDPELLSRFGTSSGDLRRSGKVVAYIGLRRKAIVVANGEENGDVTSNLRNIRNLPERIRKYMTISVQYTDWKAFWAENYLRPYSERGQREDGFYYARTPDTGPFFLAQAWAKHRNDIVGEVRNRMKYIDKDLRKHIKYKRGAKKGNYTVDYVEVSGGDL